MGNKTTAIHRRAIKRHKRAALCLVICLFLCFLAGVAFGLQAEEYRIKSAYLEKITRFIQWPEPNAATGQNAFFVIGIAGESPFNGILANDYKERRIKDKPVRIKTISETEMIKDCDLLFISASEADRLEKYILAAERFHVLTVGDTAGFAQKGVHINFYIENQKVRFSINPEAMKRAGLNAGSLLLDYATIVRPNL